ELSYDDQPTLKKGKRRPTLWARFRHSPLMSGLFILQTMLILCVAVFLFFSNRPIPITTTTLIPLDPVSTMSGSCSNTFLANPAGKVGFISDRDAEFGALYVLD